GDISTNDDPVAEAPSAAASGEVAIDIDSTAGTANKPNVVKGKRKEVQARMPPLFARDVGHVVFCGNEKMTDNGLGDGVYIT
ncbi:hypothetical protein C0991_010228, partial [Blastosporella zonata]